MHKAGVKDKRQKQTKKETRKILEKTYLSFNAQKDKILKKRKHERSSKRLIWALMQKAKLE